MSENAEAEVQEVDPIETLIGQAVSKDFTKASDTFHSLMMDRMNTALDQEKIRLADVMYNGAEDEDDDIGEDELGDEESDQVEDDDQAEDGSEEDEDEELDSEDDDEEEEVDEEEDEN
tara:strand:+ start:330 stop:683 length:354 start_codon:yes stop_codon:yes gene_type:complete